MSNQVNSMNKGLTVKDLVTTGIFTALLFVFVLVGGVFFATNPVLTFFMPAGGGLLAGPIYLLLIAKVHKRWSLSIMGIIMGIIWFVTGMHWAFALGYLIMAFTAHAVIPAFSNCFFSILQPTKALIADVMITAANMAIRMPVFAVACMVSM